MIIVWGIVLCNRVLAYHQLSKCRGLGEFYYNHVLHWFHATSWSVKTLSHQWHQWLSVHNNVKRLKDPPVYVADGIKIPKEGRKMPLVKKLHQESDNVTKPEWIRGHYFGAISLLLQSGPSLLAVPVTFEIQYCIKLVDIILPSSSNDYNVVILPLLYKGRLQSFPGSFASTA